MNGAGHEFASSQLEIRHGSRFDVILNRDATSVLEVESLAEAWRDGMPKDWHFFEPFGGPTGMNVFYVDDIDNPKYIAKERFITRALYRGHNLEERRLNSILSELALSPRIKSALATEEAVRTAGENGFEPVVFVEPLVGVIDRRSTIKTVLYRFVKGLSKENTRPYHSRLQKLANGLTAELAAKGVLPYDLYSRQFIVQEGVSGRQRPFLIDAELYARREEIPLRLI